MYLSRILARTGLVAAALAAFTVFSQPASAVTTDTLLDARLLGNSGDQTELDNLADILGLPDASSLQLSLKTDFNGSNFSQDGSQFIIDVTPNEPGYFILKFGIGGPVDQTADTFFFENIAELTKLVFENSQVNGLFKPDDLPEDTRLSHYTLIDGEMTVIPLPASLPLFLAALAGLGIVTRRRREA